MNQLFKSTSKKQILCDLKTYQESSKFILSSVKAIGLIFKQRLHNKLRMHEVKHIVNKYFEFNRLYYDYSYSDITKEFGDKGLHYDNTAFSILYYDNFYEYTNKKVISSVLLSKDQLKTLKDNLALESNPNIEIIAENHLESNERYISNPRFSKFTLKSYESRMKYKNLTNNEYRDLINNTKHKYLKRFRRSYIVYYTMNDYKNKSIMEYIKPYLYREITEKPFGDYSYMIFLEKTKLFNLNTLMPYTKANLNNTLNKLRYSIKQVKNIEKICLNTLENLDDLKIPYQYLKPINTNPNTNNVKGIYRLIHIESNNNVISVKRIYRYRNSFDRQSYEEYIHKCINWLNNKIYYLKAKKLRILKTVNNNCINLLNEYHKIHRRTFFDIESGSYNLRKLNAFNSSDYCNEYIVNKLRIKDKKQFNKYKAKIKQIANRYHEKAIRTPKDKLRVRYKQEEAKYLYILDQLEECKFHRIIIIDNVISYKEYYEEKLNEFKRFFLVYLSNNVNTSLLAKNLLNQYNLLTKDIPLTNQLINLKTKDFRLLNTYINKIYKNCFYRTSKVVVVKKPN